MSIEVGEPKTLDQWREFMNGYRDPKTVEEMRKDQDLWDSFTGHDPSGSGKRQCGNRKEGGIYATCGLSKNGMPLEHFIVCSPVSIVADDYNLSNIGVKLVDIEEPCLACGGVEPKKNAKQKYIVPCSSCNGSLTETVTHVFDIVGQEYYPNVADFLEETRRMGVSRRMELEDSRQFARLSKRSRLFLLHHRAVIKNPLDILYPMGVTETMRLRRAGCPKALTEHEPSGYFGEKIKVKAPGCSALYWHVLEEGATPIHEHRDATGPILKTHDFVGRKLAAGTYRGYGLNFDVKPQYDLGIFAVFPLLKIQVIDPDGSYGEKVKRAGAAGVDVEAVEC